MGDDLDDPSDLAGDAPIQRSGSGVAEEGPGVLARWRERLRPYEIYLVIATALAFLVPGLWGFTLIDPWETHYGEVARRMLEDDDFVHLKWQNESFRSKPVLTFWLIAASMKLFGIASGGGYSGELTSSPLAIFAVRLPFVLAAVLGLTLLWWMLAKLVSRRVAWLSVAVLLSTPFFSLVARQAITDMPMVACLMAALACFAVAEHAGGDKLRPVVRGASAHHLFWAVFGTAIAAEFAAYFFYFRSRPELARGIVLPAPGIFLAGCLLAGLAGLAAWCFWWQPIRERRRVYMLWAYVFIALAVLAKGPVIALAFAIVGLYLLIVGEYRLAAFAAPGALAAIAAAIAPPPGAGLPQRVLLGGIIALAAAATLWAGWLNRRLLDRLEVFRGILVLALVAVPWHVAMFLKDGRGWANEYFFYHWFKRVGEGVHGDRGTFDYVAAQLGIGMWPWVALLPPALAALFLSRDPGRRGPRVRLLVGIWAICSFALFAASQTKFHHYILPAVPALSIAIAFWLDDLFAGRVRHSALFAGLGIGIAALIARDFMGEQKQIIELFIYRYDRPWPLGEPWSVDLRPTMRLFAFALCTALALVALPRSRKLAAAVFLALAALWVLWLQNGYMSAAAPHWGQGQLHETYYAERQIHGVEIKYFGLAELARDWKDGEMTVESRLPRNFEVGRALRATLYLPKDAGVPGDKLVLAGRASARGANRFTLTLDTGERGRLAELIARGERAARSSRRPWLQVDADRLIAWQLNWRGENFWSSGEIYGEIEDTQTVFMLTDNKAFLDYLAAPGRSGRRYYVITEAGRAGGLKNVLPTAAAKESVETIDTSSNKFTLLRFDL